MSEKKKWYDDLPIEDRLTIANNVFKLIVSEKKYKKFCDIIKNKLKTI